MEREQLVSLWEERQNRLGELLDEWGARDCDFRADLKRNRFLWVKRDGSPVVAADCRLLLSYALEGGSILMSWANRHVPRHAAVPAQDVVAGRYLDATEEQAWIAAMAVGLGARAEFLYRAPSPELLTFLGLWNVRAARAGEDVEPESIRDLVLEVLETAAFLLRDLRRDAGVTQRILTQHGRALLERASGVDRDHPASELEAATGTLLVNMGTVLEESGPPEATVARQWRRAIAKTRRAWESLEDELGG